MAATVLNSSRAVQPSLIVIRAFVQLRQMVVRHKALAAKLAELDARVGANRGRRSEYEFDALGRPQMIASMRLTQAEAEAIREEVRRVDPTAKIYLFGSRADDSARGGDIDLLVASDRLDFRGTLRLKAGILGRIGWQQLDLVVRRSDQLGDPLAAIAVQTGVRL